MKTPQYSDHASITVAPSTRANPLTSNGAADNGAQSVRFRRGHVVHSTGRAPGDGFLMPGDDTVSPSSYFNRLEPVTTLQQSRRWLLRTATGMALAGLIGSPRRGRSQTHPNYRLPETRDLATLREQHPGKGVLLAFFMDGCAFCHEIDRTYLGVMHDHVDYRDRIVMRHVRLHRHARLIGFDGRKTGVTAFAETLRVRVTPTVVAFDADGGVVGSPLVGIRNVEFYGFDLDRLIDAATRNVS